MRLMQLLVASMVQAHLEGMTLAQLRLILEGEMEPEELNELIELVIVEARLCRKNDKPNERT